MIKAEKWRFVPGLLNDSDYATSSSIEITELIEPIWFDGPEFEVACMIEKRSWNKARHGTDTFLVLTARIR